MLTCSQLEFWLTHWSCCCCLPPLHLPLELGLPVQVGSRVSGGGGGASVSAPLGSTGGVGGGEDVCQVYLHQICIAVSTHCMSYFRDTQIGMRHKRAMAKSLHPSAGNMRMSTCFVRHNISHAVPQSLLRHAEDTHTHTHTQELLNKNPGWNSSGKSTFIFCHQPVGWFVTMCLTCT